MNCKTFLSGILFSGIILSAADVRYPVDADEAVRFCAKDMARCLSAATGKTYNCKRAGNAVKGDIVLAVNPKLREQEWQFTTKEGKLYIEGGDPAGIGYGIYTFLEKYANCSWLAPDVELLPKQPGWKIPELSEKGRPAIFLRREMSVRLENTDPVWRFRNKENVRAAYFNNSGYGSYGGAHTFNFFTKFVTDPKLFGIAKKGSRCHTLCMTNPEVRKIVLDVLLKEIEKDYNQPKTPRTLRRRIFDISQPDGPSGFECWCDNCRAFAEREGSYSGPNLDFVNYLARGVAQKYPDARLCTFAYSYTKNPPKTVKAEKNVILRFCTGSIFQPLAPGSKDAKLLEEWSCHASQLSIWSYWRTYEGSLFPQVKRRADIAAELRLCKKYNVIVYYAEDEQPLSRNFSVMQHYLALKMMDDPSQDIDKLADKFMAGYYGKGAPFVKKYLEYLEKRQEITRNFLDREFFEKSNAWLDQAEKAAAGDKLSLTHIHHERVIVDRALFSRFAQLQKSGYQFDRKALTARFAANAQECVKAWRGLGRAFREQLLDQVRKEAELYQHFPVEIPKQFDGCDVIDLHWNQQRLTNRGVPVMFVKDPDAICGTAFYNSKLEPQLPFTIGYYNDLLKRGNALRLSAADIPQDEKFHLYKIGSDLIMTGVHIQLDNTWKFRSWLSTIGIIPEEREIWVSMKFTGPRFVAGSKQPNRVLFDHILLVKAPDPMRRYKAIDPSKNLIRNGGFEQYDASGAPAYWSRSDKKLFVDTKVKHSGKASMKAHTPSRGHVRFPLGKISNLKHDLLIRGYYKYDEISPADALPFLGLWTYTKKGQNSYSKPLAEFYKGNYDWHKFERIISIEDLKRSVSRCKPQPERISLLLRCNKKGTVWIDDVEVIPLEKK